MSNMFPDELEVRICDDNPRERELVKDFRFNGMRPLTIPAGFRTDFASIPAPLRMFWDDTGRYTKAAVVHDYCYRNGLFNREICDNIFLEGCLALGVNYPLAVAMYLALRAFGRRAWRRSRCSSR